MARHVPLGLRSAVPGLRAFAFGLGLLAGCDLLLNAQTTPATNAPPVKPQHVAANVKPPATNAPPLPPNLQNTLGRYGNIVLPGDQVAYPLKLRLPNPNDDEIRVPSQDDLVKRAKLEALASLSDDDIRKELAAWPAYNKMSLRDQGAMLQRIQEFREYHARVALQKARELGLSTLTPAQQAKFEKEYWDKRLKMDQQLVNQLRPLYQAGEQRMNDDLFREFSSAMPAPAPPAPKPPAKPPQNPPKPVATAGSTLTNAAPIAQAPH
jgi:hypothetical protein